MTKNKSIKKLGGLLLVVLTVLSMSGYAQKKPFLTEQEEIIEAAYMSLDKSMKEGGELHEFKTKNEITGTYTFNITIRNKGEVATVSAVERDGEVSQQNLVKNYLKEIRFPFKMPKNRSYKFKYKFKF